MYEYHQGGAVRQSAEPPRLGLLEVSGLSPRWAYPHDRALAEAFHERVLVQRVQHGRALAPGDSTLYVSGENACLHAPEFGADDAPICEWVAEVVGRAGGGRMVVLRTLSGRLVPRSDLPDSIALLFHRFIRFAHRIAEEVTQ